MYSHDLPTYLFTYLYMESDPVFVHRSYSISMGEGRYIFIRRSRQVEGFSSILGFTSHWSALREVALIIIKPSTMSVSLG